MIRTRTAAPAPYPSNARLAMPAGERPVLFLEFEGSSLDSRSWPVEIAYAWIADGRIETRSAVIAPRPCWPMHAWSEAAAEVHGLSLRAVRAGRPADRVAAETDDFAGFDVVAADPERAQRWLDRLRAGRDPRVTVRAVEAAAADRLTPEAMRALRAALPLAERVGADARRLARAWDAAAGSAGLAQRPRRAPRASRPTAG